MTSTLTAAEYPAVVAEARRARRQVLRRRARLAAKVSLAVTVVWAVYVTASGQWWRVAEHWEAASVMSFGSFVAGSTPQGGGAVAFPVFTKMLGVPGDAARSFSLIIQSVGMTMATLYIVVNRRRIEWRALTIIGGSAVVGFLGGLYLVAQPGSLFWSARIPSPFVRVTFTILLAVMAYMVWLGMRMGARQLHHDLPRGNRRIYVALVLGGVAGGLISSLVGSGADVFTYLLVVILFGLDPKIGVPTSVIIMTIVSLLGLAVLGLADGQLDVQPAADRSAVVAVGDQWVAADVGEDGADVGFLGPTSESRPPDAAPLTLTRFDVFGLWLAALPVVAWGAPLGTLFAAWISRRGLVAFVFLLAAAEIVSTAIFLPELYSNVALAGYAVGGLAIALGAMWLLVRHRRRLFGLAGVDLELPLTPLTAEIAPGFRLQGSETGL